MTTLTAADLAKARAFAKYCEGAVDTQAAVWICALADEVEALRRALASAQDGEQAAMTDAARLAAENEELRGGLAEIYAGIARLGKLA